MAPIWWILLRIGPFPMAVYLSWKVKVVAVAGDRASYLCPTMTLRSQPQTYRDGRPSDDEDMGVPLAEEVHM